MDFRTVVLRVGQPYSLWLSLDIHNALRLGNDGRLVLNIVPRALLAQTRNVMRRLGRHGLDALPEFVRISVPPIVKAETPNLHPP